MGRHTWWLVAMLLIVGVAGGCGGGTGAPSTASTRPRSVDSAGTTAPLITAPPTTAAANSYTSRQFQPTLTVPPPPGLPPVPVVDDEHFLTWVGDGADIDRAVRFMSPIGLYDPGRHPHRLSPVPRDYVHYLLGLRRFGVHFSHRSIVTVDGERATVVTISTDAGLSGALGCQQHDLSPDDCYGIQTFAVIRLAILIHRGQILLAWARSLPSSATVAQDFAAFDALLSQIRFS